MAIKKQKLVHPGEILLHDFMKPLALSSYKVAKELGVSGYSGLTKSKLISKIRNH